MYLVLKKVFHGLIVVIQYSALLNTVLNTVSDGWL